MTKKTIRWYVGALVLGLLWVPAARAQQALAPIAQDSTVMPEGPKGARIRSLIEALGFGDPNRVRRFIDEECAPEFRERKPLSSILDFLQDTDGVDFYGIRSYTPERPETVVIVRDRLFRSWRAMVFRFGEGPGFQVTGITFMPARPPAGAAAGSPEPPLTEKAAVEEIRAFTAKLTAQKWLSGTVLIAKGPTVLFSAVGGEASKSFHVPNNIDTKFNLGSMNKMFTALAAARLVEQGKLSFDDPISKYLDETWLPKDIADKITIRHLITHTSGLGSYFNRKFMESSRALFRKLDDYKPLIKDDKPRFAPGERFMYSNTGMFLLGAVIEKAAGEDYFDHIRKVIYAPAGMTDTDSYEMDYPVENLAIGYSPDSDSPYRWQNNLYSHVIKGGPAGGGFSTVKDLHKFALALLGDKFVSLGMRQTLWTDTGAQYGYGFEVKQGPAGKVVGHSGGAPGINSNLDMFLDSGYIVAVMSNYDNGASPLADWISQILARVKAR